MTKTAEELADEHWDTYVRVVVEVHEEDEDVIMKIGVHYRTAFVHGFKHGVESVKENGS